MTGMCKLIGAINSSACLFIADTCLKVILVGGARLFYVDRSLLTPAGARPVYTCM